jgi:hypothetical protein
MPVTEVLISTSFGAPIKSIVYNNLETGVSQFVSILRARISVANRGHRRTKQPPTARQTHSDSSQSHTYKQKLAALARMLRL